MIWCSMSYGFRQKRCFHISVYSLNVKCERRGRALFTPGRIQVDGATYQILKFNISPI